MTDAERREAARLFYQKWAGKGKEDEDDRSYWLDILQRLMGADDATDRIEFQKKVIVDGNTKRIDAYIPETKVIIEQKTLGIDLSKKGHQSGGIALTPYEQAKRYNDNLPSSEKARWIVTSNFSEIWVYDMDTREPEKNITKIFIKDLQSHYFMLDFLLSKKVKKVTEEMELSLKAGELVGKIYDRFLAQYHNPKEEQTQKSLNILCVRLVFCLYAEDAGLFGDRCAFSKYIEQYKPKDIRQALLNLFKVLDTPYDKRGELYLDEELEAFPYCNGGLFEEEKVEIPQVTQEIKDTLIESAHFDWSKISPTIFGAVFESTLNPVTRRSGGMHYTSIENIHKVIDPLFLDDLKAEFETIKSIKVARTRDNKLRAFQDKLANLKFLEPACGSGNFLTETYLCIRRLENDILRELQRGQIVFADANISPIKVSINQFYGIEINDFAVTVAKTALWIAESQMMKETEDIVLMHLDFLPLKTNATIIEGNALRLDWNIIVHKNELSYIMGNPPFVGYSLQIKDQKEDILSVYVDEKGKPYKTAGKIDYVSGWYFKAAQLMKNTGIRTAFISTNSITQGEQVTVVWKPLYDRFGVHIDFAHRTFKWNSEASEKAAVHCVIVGFSQNGKAEKQLYDNDRMQFVKNINPYLIAAPTIFIDNRSKPICKVTEMSKGSIPVDDGNFFFTADEYVEFIKNEPKAEKYIKKFYGAREFLHDEKRWCLWLLNVSPSDLKVMPLVMKRIENVRNFRLKSTKAATRKYANYSTRFMEIRQPKTKYLIVPSHSSENRKYIPLGFVEPDIICGNANLLIPDATLYEFGILTSNVHMAWVRTVCGRLGMGYRYSATIVYNNFPWPNVTDEQKAEIEKTAKGILDARELYPDCSLADLYDPLTMPPELRKAHQANDRAVMQAYGLSVKDTSEADCVAFLMKMYQELKGK